MIWLLATIAIIALWYLLRPYKYWIERGVKQGNPVFLFGDNWGIALHKQSFADMVQMVYNIAPNSRYCGMYQFLLPTLVLRDPDLIKDITVKDFDHFINHRTSIPEDCDPLWGKNLFNLTNQNWRDMRTTLSPAFTSSKMKHMFSLISQSGEQFAQHFLNQNEEVITVEMKDTYTRFTNDVIANTVFGVKCDSLGERNNEFYLMGKEATDFSGFSKTIKFVGYLLIPRLFKVFNVKLFSKQVSHFFIKLVQENIASREKHSIVRPDMIHLLMEARKHGFKNEESHPIRSTVEETQITDEDITAQALIFFLGGFDSVSSLMCFMSYELGINLDIQGRLRQEIDDTLESCDGKLTYEAIMNMKYMDMVVSETLRLWPNTAVVDRVCTKPYTIEPKTPEERAVYLKKDDVLWLPIHALHRDPKHFPNPDRFDPERFSDENKDKIKPYSYIPFGSGPRNCIGSRFALLEVKALFFHILSNFEIVPVEKTQIPLKIKINSFNLTAEGGFWLGLKRRVK